jgi:hypothetical protein
MKVITVKIAIETTNKDNTISYSTREVRIDENEIVKHTIGNLMIGRNQKIYRAWLEV